MVSLGAALLVWTSVSNLQPRAGENDGGGPAKTFIGDAGMLPSVAVSGRAIHVVWIGAGAITYRRSPDSGASWAAPQVLASDARIANYGIRPSVAASGSDVYVAWAMRGGTGTVVEVRASRDGGQTWAPPQNLGDAGAVTLVAATGGRGRSFAITTDDRGVWCRASADHGGRWSAPVNVVALGAGWTYPAAAAQGSAVHVVVWTLPLGGGTRRVLYARSKDGCAGFGGAGPLAAPQDVGGPRQDIGEPHPAIAVSGERVHVVWSEVPDPGTPRAREEIVLRTSGRAGASFAPPVVLAARAVGPTRLSAKAIAVSGTTVLVASNLGTWVSDGGDAWQFRSDWIGEAIAADGDLASLVGVDQTPSGHRVFHVRIRR